MKVKELLGAYEFGFNPTIRIMDFRIGDTVEPLVEVFEGTIDRIPSKYKECKVYGFCAYATNCLEITITGGEK